MVNHSVGATLVLLTAAISVSAVADSLSVPSLVGQDIYHAHRTLKKFGMVSRFEQVEEDTAKVPLFFESMSPTRL